MWACDLAEKAAQQACATVKHVTEMAKLSENLSGQSTQSPPTSGQSTQSPPTSGQSTQSPPTSGQSTQSPPTSGQSTQSPPTSGQSVQSPPTSTTTNSNTDPDSDELNIFASQFAGTGVFLDIKAYRKPKAASSTQSPSTMKAGGHPPIKTIDKCPPNVGRSDEKCLFTIAHSSSGPPPFTVTPLKGGKPFIANKYKLSERAKAKKFDIKDPKDKAKINAVMENVKKQHASLFAKEETLFKTSHRNRQKEVSSSHRYTSNLGTEGLYTGSAPHSIHGTTSNLSHGTVSIPSHETTPHKDFEFSQPDINSTDLMSQFNSIRDLQESHEDSERYESEYSMPFGNDKIGLKENNIFLMINKSYEKHRTADEFIEGNKPSSGNSKSKKALMPSHPLKRE